jgi:hypothetical protein
MLVAMSLLYMWDVYSHDSDQSHCSCYQGEHAGVQKDGGSYHDSGAWLVLVDDY